MRVAAHRAEAPSAICVDLGAIFVSLELSRSSTEFGHLRHIGNVVRIRRLGMFRLDLNGALESRRAAQFCYERTAVLQGPSRIIARFGGDGLQCIEKGGGRRRDGGSFFDAAQNARVVRAAEYYYRLMYRSSRKSWNLRDRHMFDTSCGCSPRVAAMRKPSSGHIIHMSAMPRRLPWAGKASSTSANPAARPSAIQQYWSALAPIAGQENHSRAAGQL